MTTSACHAGYGASAVANGLRPPRRRTFCSAHVSDTIRWFFHPAEVEAVYAITQRKALEYSPDLFDAFLFFDTGLKVRVKADWIKFMEGLVEYYKCINGAKGTIFYNKVPGFNVKEASWRANFEDVPPHDLMKHQEELMRRGAAAHIILHQPRASVGGPIMQGLVMGAGQPPATKLMDHILASIQEGVPVPSTWQGNGGLPTGEDGLKQTKIVSAIIESADTRKEVRIE